MNNAPPSNRQDQALLMPRFAQRLLGAVLPWDREADVLGDLEELHRRRLNASSRVTAGVSTNLHALWIAAAFVILRLREGDVPAPSRIEWLLALRLARKQPLLTVAAVLSLGVGIAVAVVAFTMSQAAVGAQLPVPDGEHFVRFEVRDGEGQPLTVTGEMLEALEQGTETLRHVGGAEVRDGTLRFEAARVGTAQLERNRDDSGDRAAPQLETARIAEITPTTLEHVPMRPLFGRTLEVTDAEPGATPVAVVSESLWRRAFPDRSDLRGGARFQVAGTDTEIVGVLPHTYRFPAGGDVWIPLSFRERAEARTGWFAIGNPTASHAAIAAEVGSLFGAALPLDHAAREAGSLRVVVRGFTEMPGGATPLMLMGLFVPGFVLLVIALNVANLLRARTATRLQELGLRSVLGAPRSRLVSQLTIEAAVLAVGAAALGWLVGARILQWIDAALVERPYWIDLSPQTSTAAAAALCALIVTVLCGVQPALSATGRRAQPVQGGRFTKLDLGPAGAALMVTQMALSIALLSGALLMARSFQSSTSRQLDLPDDRVLTAQIVVPETATEGVPGSTGRGGAAHPMRAVAVALRELPEVASVGTADFLPRHDAASVPIELEGRAPIDLPASRARVTPGFLEALDATVLDGRLLDERDWTEQGARAVVVNEPFVDRFFGGASPLGARLRRAATEADPAGPWLDIVGVVPDLGLSGFSDEYAAGYYEPGTVDRRYFYVAIHTRGDPRAFEPTLRDALDRLDADLSLSRIELLGAVNGEERAFQAGFGSVMLLLGLFALGLALLGVYSMISILVTQRRREIGVRLALGATRSAILGAVLRRAGTTLALGALLGGALGLAALQLQDKMLAARLPATEPWIVPTVVVVFAACGALACWLPAIRALRIAPQEALASD